MTAAQNNNNKHLLGALIVIAALVLLDQASKWWILNIFELPSKRSVELLPFLRFTMVWNEGISMGIALGEFLGKWGIVILTGLISTALAVWRFKSTRHVEQIALTLVLGGAIGNLIDRFVHGAVVDFVHLHAGDYNFYVFNLADSAISIGFILLLIDGLRGEGKSPKNASKVADKDADLNGDSE